MDFDVDPPLRELLDRAGAFVQTVVLPLERPLLDGPFHELEPALDAARAQARAMGLWLPHMPREYGGLALNALACALVGQELGRSPLGHYAVNMQAPDAGNMEILRRHGTPAQQERYLQPLLSGRMRSCFCLTEPEHPGSNPTWLSTRAVPCDDGWQIDGHKWFATGADGAGLALVLAITDRDAPPHRRASLFAVELPAEGFRCVRNLAVMGHTGDGWASHSEIELNGLRVPANSLVGPRGAGFLLAQDRLAMGRLHHCARWIGVAERAFELMCERAASRRLAPGELLASRQIVQSWVAESRAAIDAARLLVLHTAWRLDEWGEVRAAAAVSMIKFHVAAIVGDVLDRAIQVHGALGLTDDTILSFLCRQERAGRIYDGPDEVHKSFVARRILSAWGLRQEDGP